MAAPRGETFGILNVMPKATVRIGNGCGFWGDNLDAPVELACRGRLDYLTLEYLAELTMSILAVQRQKDPTGRLSRVISCTSSNGSAPSCLRNQI